MTFTLPARAGCTTTTTPIQTTLEPMKALVAMALSAVPSIIESRTDP